MKKLIVLLLCCSLMFPLSACGGNEEKEPAEKEVETQEPAEPAKQDNMMSEDKPAEDFTEVTIGGDFTTEFADLTFDETDFAADLRPIVPLKQVAENTKLEPVPGYKYIYLKGTITNKTAEDIAVSDFMAANFRIDQEHNYGLSGDKCIVLNEDNTQAKVVPAGKTLTYVMYNSVADEIADNSQSILFFMGFFNNFDSGKLDQLLAYDDNPIIKCPYQLKMVIK